MLRNLTPNEWADTVLAIDFAHHRKNGRRFLVIDLDNTLALRKKEVVAAISNHLLEQLKKKNLDGICIVTNPGLGLSNLAALRLQAATFSIGAKDYVAALGTRSKPHPFAFIKAAKILGAKPEEVICVGDQIFTDIWGGNRAGFYTVKTKPLGPDGFYTTPKRWLESLLTPFLK